jgi:hypothetical protein
MGSGQEREGERERGGEREREREWERKKDREWIGRRRRAKRSPHMKVSMRAL